MHTIMEGKKMIRSPEMDAITSEQRPWSELPMDILLLIAQFLDQKEDRVHCFAVCKSWKSVTPFIPRHKKGTPLLLSHILGNHGVGELFDPLSQKTCPALLPELNETVFGCSNDGWLLLRSSDEYISDGEAKEPGLFFFNAFTKARIDLPVPLAMGTTGSTFCPYAFSSPSLPDWTIFDLEFSSHYKVVISSYHSGDGCWTRTVYPVKDDDRRFIQTRTNVVSHKGIFYCLGECGTLGVFDSTEGTWTVTCPKIGKHFTDLVDKYFVESNGELFVVDDHGIRVNVFWLDKSKMEWVRVKSLGDTTLFVGSAKSVMATTCNPSMENRIFFGKKVQQANQIMSYSLGTSKYQPMTELCGSWGKKREFKNLQLQVHAWIHQPEGFEPSSTNFRYCEVESD